MAKEKDKDKVEMKKALILYWHGLGLEIMKLK